MNTPFSSHSWRQLREHAAAQLSPNFADNVLRATRVAAAAQSPWERWFANQFAISAATAAICLLGLVFVHAQKTAATSDQHLADWMEISVQTASLEPNP
jgi:hypothetical protein